MNLTERISGRIIQFRDNENKQAEYTEEVAASIEEELTGINSAADNTDIQDFNLEILFNLSLIWE